MSVSWDELAVLCDRFEEIGDPRHVDTRDMLVDEDGNPRLYHPIPLTRGRPDHRPGYAIPGKPKKYFLKDLRTILTPEQRAAASLAMATRAITRARYAGISIHQDVTKLLDMLLDDEVDCISLRSQCSLVLDLAHGYQRQWQTRMLTSSQVDRLSLAYYIAQAAAGGAGRRLLNAVSGDCDCVEAGTLVEKNLAWRRDNGNPYDRYRSLYDGPATHPIVLSERRWREDYVMKLVWSEVDPNHV